MLHRTLVCSFAVHCFAAGQSHLIPIGTNAINAGAAFTVNDFQSHTSATIGGTYVARIDLAVSYANLSRNVISEVKHAKSYSLTAAYTFLRAERGRIYAAIQYSHGIHTITTRDVPSTWPNDSYHVETRQINTYALTAGFLPRDSRSLNLVPSLAMGLGFPTNRSMNDKTSWMLAAEVVLLVPVGDASQFLPYLGIGLINEVTFYSAGFRWPLPVHL